MNKGNFSDVLEAIEILKNDYIYETLRLKCELAWVFNNERNYLTYGELMNERAEILDLVKINGWWTKKH